MIDMFGNNADLGGLLDSTVPLKVSEAIHKAIIEVSEDGVEAAGANGKSHIIICCLAKFDKRFDSQIICH